MLKIHENQKRNDLGKYLSEENLLTRECKMAQRNGTKRQTMIYKTLHRNTNPTDYRYSGKVSSSCSTSDTCRVIAKRHQHMRSHVKVVHKKTTCLYFLVQYTQKCINFTHLSHKPIKLCVIYLK